MGASPKRRGIQKRRSRADRRRRRRKKRVGQQRRCRLTESQAQLSVPARLAVSFLRRQIFGFASGFLAMSAAPGSDGRAPSKHGYLSEPHDIQRSTLLNQKTHRPRVANAFPPLLPVENTAANPPPPLPSRTYSGGGGGGEGGPQSRKAALPQRAAKRANEKQTLEVFNFFFFVCLTQI